MAARLATVLDKNDPRRTQTEQSLRSRDTVVRRAALKQAMEIAYDASDEEYTRLRDFRNIILLTAALISGCMWILAVVAAANPQYLPVCFTPTADVTATVCPSGAGQPTSAGDVLIVAGLGALGGGLAALLAIRNLRGPSTPYSLPVALAVLKVPSGALTAVAGLLLLGGGFAPGFSDLDSQRQILAYALVFGYAQQVATRLVDNHAQLVLNKVPSKDPEGKQPDQPVTAATVIETPQAVPHWPTNGQRPRRTARVRQAALQEPSPDGMTTTLPPARLRRRPMICLQGGSASESEPITDLRPGLARVIGDDRIPDEPSSTSTFWSASRCTGRPSPGRRCSPHDGPPLSRAEVRTSAGHSAQS